jgi:hypothetical protein
VAATLKRLGAATGHGFGRGRRLSAATLDGDHLVKGTWTVVEGKATDLGVGAKGTVWIIGTSAIGENFDILKRSGTKWVKADGAATRIDAAHKVYRQSKGKWGAIDLWGAKALGFGSDGTAVLALNENGTAPDFSVLDGKVLSIGATLSIALP